MTGKLTPTEQSRVDAVIGSQTTGERTKWCRDVLSYLGQFKWAGSNPDWDDKKTLNLAMNCWCAPIYIAYQTKRLQKKTVTDFNLLVFKQDNRLSALHKSQAAAYEFLHGEAGRDNEGIAGDLILFFIDSLAGIYGDKAPFATLDKCPVHCAVNMGNGECVSLWSTPNDYDKYQLCKISELTQAIERDRKANCYVSSIEPFWIMGAQSKKKCYITTATCESRGLPDDCHELVTLRWFRDNIVTSTAGGSRDVAKYYEHAPRIIEQIDLRADAGEIYDWLYREYITPSVDAVERGDYQQAYAFFKEAVGVLGERYCSGINSSS